MNKELIEKLQEMDKAFMDTVAQSFEGVEVRVDPHLIGIQSYVMVSKDLYNKIKEHKCKKTFSEFLEEREQNPDKQSHISVKIPHVHR